MHEINNIKTAIDGLIGVEGSGFGVLKITLKYLLGNIKGHQEGSVLALKPKVVTVQ